MRIVLKLAFIGFGIFVVLQLFRPSLPNPPITADLVAPPQVKEILRTSCYDCHSNETRLLWFDRIVPAYWLVSQDVKLGRKHLNFSEIGALSPDQQKGILFEGVDQVMLGAMPPKNYEALHPDARMTPEKLAVLKSYLNPYTAAVPSNPTQIASADSQFDAWTHKSGDSTNVQPTLNGISFQPDYKDWKTISSSDRPDNRTIRQILGNDIAVKAVQENQVNPWPDGTKFAKIAWKEIVDEQGTVRPGEFFQVEFMMKDSQKYASTLGWGFARWRGMDLKPYGKDANFTSECVGCHTPMSANDYVFTSPIKGAK